MSVIESLRNVNVSTVFLGSHPGVIQSILDYDYLVGKQKPSVVAIVAVGRKNERYFWGDHEVIIKVSPSISMLSPMVINDCTIIINVQSARRVLSSTKEAIDTFPRLQVVNIFAEQTPEAHSLELVELAKIKQIMIIGPSSVGLLLPGFAKVGAIGGVQYRQLVQAKVDQSGNVAVISTSGGMVNELIHMVTENNYRISFALAIGGDRFPVTSAVDAMLLAQHDVKTDVIVYFGELGGSDEYEIAQLIDDGILTKPVVAYIAGIVSELFEDPPQFGHAKALAQSPNESAIFKKKRLRRSNVNVCDRIGGIPDMLKKVSKPVKLHDSLPLSIEGRRKRPFMSHISGERNGEMKLLGDDLLTTIQSNSLGSLVISMLLGKQINSVKLSSFTEMVLRLLVDHGPYVSGAVNTIVTARAGRDLVSGLTAGLLTIGPRFGGAINAASKSWVEGVRDEKNPKVFVDSFIKSGGVIPGIGHKKYRIDMPDPRVQALVEFTGSSNGDRYLKYAQSIESVTTAKKGNLILNIDGAIGAIMVDLLESELGYTPDELIELSDIEFFNALFIISRSIGFTAHYLDQRRHDEGLFRLNEEEVRYME